MRELMNNLPEAFKDVPNMPVRGQRDDTYVAERLVNSYNAVEFSDSGETSSNRESLVTVPYALVRAVKDFVTDYGTGTRRRKLRDSVSVLGRLDENDPTLALWTDARKFFMRLTHIGPRATASVEQLRPVPHDDQMLQHLECVEAALMTRLGDFFDNMHAIEDLVTEANKQASGVGE